MAKVTVMVDTCKGCGLCVTVCPKGVLAIDKSKLNAKGYNAVAAVEPEKCIGCAFCAKMCPDCALEVEK